MQHSESFLIGSQIETRQVEPGITRQIMGYDDKIMVAKVCFEGGITSGAHSHGVHSQSSYVSSGVFEITLDGQSRVLRAGDGFFAAPGVEHCACCIERGVLIDTFSPIREDFLR
ncbi:MAG: cupin domain-containing protein [Mucinivorans sp.]